MPDSKAPLSARILVVDDDPAIREMLTLFLEAMGYGAATAENGHQALEAFSEGDWSLVITDRMMPGMSGEEMAAAIRQVDATVPIVLSTGELSDSPHGFPFDAILLKPFSLQTLATTIESAIRGTREKANVELPSSDFEKERSIVAP